MSDIFSGGDLDPRTVALDVIGPKPGAFAGAPVEAAILADDGALHEIGPGTLLFTPDGWRGTWHVRATVRKTFVIWKSG